MAVNKNFVVKNGLEVNDNLLVADVDTQKVGIGTSVSSYELHVSGGIGATDLYVCGVTTLGSAGGITTTGGDLYIGGDLYVLDDVVYDEVTGRNLNISGVSTFAGIGTFQSDLYVGGDLYVLDDIVYDEVVGRNLSISGVGTIASANIDAGDVSVAYANVTGVSTFDGVVYGSTGLAAGSAVVVGSAVSIAGITTLAGGGGITTTGGDLYIGGDLYVQDDIVYDEQTARNLNVTGIATIATLVGYSSEFSGAIGFSSQTSATDSSTLIGAAVTTINFIGGGATAHTSADGTVQNLTLPAAGASIGLAIALGG